MPVTKLKELLDSRSEDRLVAVVEQRGARKDKESGQKKDPASWEELDAIFHEFGKRLRCRLNNARLPEDQWTDCRASGEE